jgi:hypothetical protein
MFQINCKFSCNLIRRRNTPALIYWHYTAVTVTVCQNERTPDNAPPSPKSMSKQRVRVNCSLLVVQIHVSIKKSKQCQLIVAFCARNLSPSTLLACVNVTDSGFTFSERDHLRNCPFVGAVGVVLRRLARITLRVVWSVSITSAGKYLRH